MHRTSLSLRHLHTLTPANAPTPRARTGMMPPEARTRRKRALPRQATRVPLKPPSAPPPPECPGPDCLGAGGAGSETGPGVVEVDHQQSIGSDPMLEGRKHGIEDLR